MSKHRIAVPVTIGVFAVLIAGALWLVRPAAPSTPLEGLVTTPAEHARQTVRARFASLPRQSHGENVTRYFPAVASSPEQWSGGHPEEVTVAPYPDLPLSFSRTREEQDGPITTWVGRNSALPGATFVGVARPGGYDAVLLVPGASQFFFHVRNGEVRVEESAATGEDCGVGNLPRRLTPAPEPSVSYAEAAGGASQEGLIPASAETAEASHAAGTPANSDVLFLYNTFALQVAQQRSTDPIGYMDGYSRASLETCNQALENSRIDAFRWRFIGLAAAPAYPQKSTVGEEVRVMVDDGPLAAFVGQIRRTYGADQVLMWVGTGDRKGAAYAGEVRGTAAPLDYAVAILRLTAPVLILGHELSHNFGCHHDRAHAGSGGGDQAQPDGDGYWCYGVLWDDPASEGGTTSGTVMAYADWLVPYFSNPAITLDVTSTMQGRGGTARSLGSRTIGFTETDPRAANNSRVLTESAPSIVALGSEDETTPVIWDHPSNASVNAGAEIRLQVAASGRNLTYQWSKDGAALAGATAATFTRNAAAADAGSYTVAITNSRGTVTSRTAAVTVAAAPAPTPPAPTPVNSGGGGGGGGSASWAFAGVIAWLLVQRCRRSTLT